MSNTIGMELHEEIVTELQYKVEELERDVDDLNEEIADNEQAYKETIVDLAARPPPILIMEVCISRAGSFPTVFWMLW